MYSINIRWLSNRFSALADESGEWDTFRDAYIKVAQAVLGFHEYAKHEWISDSIRNLAEKKRAARLKHDLDQYKKLNRQCKKSARQDKQNSGDAKDLQSETELARGLVKMLFHVLEISDPPVHRKCHPFLTTTETFISDKNG